MAVFWTASKREKEKYAITAKSIPKFSIDLFFNTKIKNLYKYIYKSLSVNLAER